MSVVHTSKSFGHSRGWSIFWSIMLMLGGLFAIALPGIAGLTVTLMFGWILICAGIFHLIYAFQQKGAGAVTWQVILALVYAATGVYVLFRPGAGLASLTVVLGIYLFAEAFMEFLLSYELRKTGAWGWFLVDGIVTLILACMIVSAWPWSSLWAIGTLVGISILMSGVARLAFTMSGLREESVTP